MASSAVANIYGVLRDVSAKTMDQVSHCLRKYDDLLQWLKEWSENAIELLNDSSRNKNDFPTHFEQKINSEGKGLLPSANSINAYHDEVCFELIRNLKYHGISEEKIKPQKDSHEMAESRHMTETEQREVSAVASIPGLKTTSENIENAACTVKMRESGEDLLKHEGVLNERFSEIKRMFPSLYSSEASSEHTPSSSLPSVFPKLTKLYQTNTEATTDSSTIRSRKVKSYGSSVMSSNSRANHKEVNPQVIHKTPHPSLNSLGLTKAPFNPYVNVATPHKAHVKRKKLKRIRSRLNNYRPEYANNLECTCLRRRVKKKVEDVVPFRQVIVETPTSIFQGSCKVNQNKVKRQIVTNECITSISDKNARQVAIPRGPMTRKRRAEEMRKQQAEEKVRKRKLSLQKQMVEKRKKQREARMKKCKENRDKLGREHKLKEVEKTNAKTKSSARKKIPKQNAPKSATQSKIHATNSASDQSSPQPSAAKLRKLTFVVSKTVPNVTEEEGKSQMLVKIGKRSSSFSLSASSSCSSSGNAPESENYDISDLKESDESESSMNSKPVPTWAKGVRLKEAIIKQFYTKQDSLAIFGQMPRIFKLKDVFKLKNLSHSKRNSSAEWDKHHAAHDL